MRTMMLNIDIPAGQDCHLEALAWTFPHESSSRHCMKALTVANLLLSRDEDDAC